MKLLNKKCRVCEDKPAAENRLVCNSCRKMNYNKNKDIVKSYLAKPITDKEVEEIKIKNKSNYHPKEYWIETPHKIEREWRVPDNFNNWY